MEKKGFMKKAVNTTCPEGQREHSKRKTMLHLTFRM
jgi:hypothetical protein